MGFILFKKAKMRYAIEAGDLKEMNRLLDAGLDVNMQDDMGRSFLYHAVELGNIDAVQLLMQRGAPVDDQLYYRGTLLHAAVARGNVEIATLLIASNKRLLNVKNRMGSTPLHLAARKGYRDMVLLLIEKGIDTEAKNFENRTALYLAQQERQEDIVQLLKPFQPQIRPEAKPAPAAVADIPPPSTDGWRKLSNDKVAHVVQEYGIGYRLTEIFNFKNRERTRLYQNIETKVEAVESKSFDDIHDKAGLEEALLHLHKMGGKGTLGGLAKKKMG